MPADDVEARIVVRFVGEGWHNWPEAPEHRAYLRASHRHLFHIEASTSVTHDDREVEFHDVRSHLETLWGLISGPERNVGHMSCEMLARRIGAELKIWAGDQRSWEVGVFEDGEAGAVVRC